MELIKLLSRPADTAEVRAHLSQPSHVFFLTSFVDVRLHPPILLEQFPIYPSHSIPINYPLGPYLLPSVLPFLCPLLSQELGQAPI